MKFLPHPYQFAALKFAVDKKRAGILLPVGLGKTAIALKAIQLLQQSGQIKRTLVVAPLRALYQVWPKELAKWDDFHGMTMSNLRDHPEQSAQLELINPENLVKILQAYPTRWDSAIIDEASMFKDSRTKRFRALRAVLHQFKVRYILTGSPAPNGLIDIWALAYIVDRGAALGEYITKFRNMFCMRSGYLPYDKWMVVPGFEKAIYERLKPIMYRIDINDAGLKLPDLIHNHISISLPLAAQQQYDEMEKHFLTVVEKETIISPNAAAAGMRCRQIANGRIYVPNSVPRQSAEVHTEKVEALRNLITEQQGQPLLVLYEFQHDEEAIQAALGPLPNLTKATTEAKIQQIVGDWNAGKIPVLLGHPRSMGRALNLQGSCSAVCFFGLPWALDDYEQSIGRVHRQGNTAHRVIVHHIVAKGTLDEEVLHVLRQKAKTQNDLNHALTRRLKDETESDERSNPAYQHGNGAAVSHLGLES